VGEGKIIMRRRRRGRRKKVIMVKELGQKTQ